MKTLPENLKVHVVSHTHWDREWRQPFEFFQTYLVKCLDKLFGIFERNHDYKSFLLDGQAVILDDYLEMRPERTEDVRRWLKTGRLFAGPWYSLIDNNLVAGESIIRNLLYGTRIAKEYGGCMHEGYLISSFGHCGQMPQIFSGFGISSIIFSRGISQWQTKSELVWEAPDGTRALAIHLPDRYTKSNWFYLIHRPGCVGRDAMDWKYRWHADSPVHSCDKDSANNYWWRTGEKFLADKANWIRCVEQLIEKALSASSIPILLAMDGVDHLFPHEAVTDIIRTANEYFGREVLIHSSLPAYIADVRSCVEKNHVKLEVKRGEMRRPMRVPGFNQLLAGTASARMRMKLLNHAAETALIRIAEPLCTLAWLNGSEYPGAFLNKAWKLLMANHAHDGICGTSTDAVHNAMADRYVRARNLADFLTYEAIKKIAAKIDMAKLAERELALAVFNTTGFTRTRVVRAVVDIPYEWGAAGVEVCDIGGKPVPFVLCSKQREEREILADHDAQLGFLCLRIELEFLAQDLPAYGYKTFIVRPGIWQHPNPQSAIRNPPAPARLRQSAIASAAAQIENEFLKVRAESDGSLTLTDKKTGQVYTGLNVFASSGDVGDSTTFMPPMDDFTVYSSGFDTGVEVAEKGPLRASLRIIKRMRIPAYCEPKAKPVELVETAQPFKAHRSPETIEETITSTITLEYGARRIEIRIEVENQTRDHRLRVLFPTGARGAETWLTDAPFDVVERAIKLPDTHNWAEPWPETQPIQSWFAVSDAERGLAIFTKGIPEAACIDDEERTLALTLLRCTRRSIGEDYAQEGAQCLGRYIFEYAVQPFSGDWKRQGFPRTAADFVTPVRAILSAPGREGILPDEAEHVSLNVQPENLAGNIVVSSIKKAEDSDALIMRIFNPTPDEISAKVQAADILGEPKRVRLDESPQKLQNADKSERTQFTIHPYKIISLLFQKR